MNATTSSRVLRALATLALITLCACSDDTSGGGDGGGDDTNNGIRARNNGGGGGGGGGGEDTGGGGEDTGGGGGGNEDAGGGGGGGDDDAGVVIEVDAGCTPGEVLGCFDANSELVCDPTGQSYTNQTCPNSQLCLQGACTDMICIPGTSSCADTQNQQICNAAGDGYDAPTPCAEGSVCSDDTCKSICELGKYRSSYIGCEYTTIDLDQYTDPGTNPKPDEIPHSVVISNPNTQPVTVSFRSNAVGVSVNVPDPVVPAGGVKAFTMPRLDVTGTGITRNSISVSATLPVVAHQFSPLNNQGVFSNDASLLLPRNTLGDEYYTIGWPTQPISQGCIAGLPCFEDQHAYVTIVATEPGQTALLVIPAAPLKAGGGIGNIPKGISRSFTLSQGEVLNLEAGPMGLTDDKDLTGTYIKATQPIAVFAGHEEAVIGEPGSNMDSCCADHLQQQMFPLKDWGQTYVAALSPSRGTKKDHWKILAGADGVTVTTNPPQPGAASSTLNKGEFVEFFSDQDFEIDANGPILVGQFLVSQQQTTSVTGDPAFLLSVPTEKFRKDYVLLTPSGYNEDFVGIIRPAGAPIELDGQVVSDANFRPIASGTWEVGYFPVQPGQHTLEANVEFGISAYGFDTAVSYGYPGGLNLIGDETQAP